MFTTGFVKDSKEVIIRYLNLKKLNNNIQCDYVIINILTLFI